MCTSCTGSNAPLFLELPDLGDLPTALLSLHTPEQRAFVELHAPFDPRVVALPKESADWEEFDATVLGFSCPSLDELGAPIVDGQLSASGPVRLSDLTLSARYSANSLSPWTAINPEDPPIEWLDMRAPTPCVRFEDPYPVDVPEKISVVASLGPERALLISVTYQLYLWIEGQGARKIPIGGSATNVFATDNSVWYVDPEFRIWRIARSDLESPSPQSDGPFFHPATRLCDGTPRAGLHASRDDRRVAIVTNSGQIIELVETSTGGIRSSMLLDRGASADTPCLGDLAINVIDEHSLFALDPDLRGGVIYVDEAEVLHREVLDSLAGVRNIAYSPTFGPMAVTDRLELFVRKEGGHYSLLSVADTLGTMRVALIPYEGGILWGRVGALHQYFDEFGRCDTDALLGGDEIVSYAELSEGRLLYMPPGGEALFVMDRVQQAICDTPFP